MKKLLLILLALPSVLFSQNHSIDTMNLEMIGTTLFENVSSNTYYNTNDSCVVSWSVVEVLLPNGWEYSFCFPDCYPIGQASGQDNFMPNEQIYLGCHFYPNQIPGVGTIKLEIITNGIYTDTVTWNGIINPLTSIQEHTTNKELLKVTDLLGRETKGKKNQPLLYLYDNGTVEKRITID